MRRTKAIILAQEMERALMERAIKEGCPFVKQQCALAFLRCCPVVEEWMESRKAKKKDGFYITPNTRTTAFLPKDLFQEEADHGYKKERSMLEL